MVVSDSQHLSFLILDGGSWVYLALWGSSDLSEVRGGNDKLDSTTILYDVRLKVRCDNFNNLNDTTDILSTQRLFEYGKHLQRRCVRSSFRD